MTDHQWTPTEEALLDLMVAMGASHKEIALRLGRTEKVVQRKASRMGALKRAREAQARRGAEEARLRATEADLSAFLPVVEDEPLDDRAERRRAANRTYRETNREKVNAHQRQRYATDEKYRERKKRGKKAA